MYVICIPSYKRATICNEKTLKTLSEIDSSRIYVYVTEEDYEIYNSTLDKSRYNKLIIGEKGLVQQRQFIMNQWDTNQQIVFFDDDIEKIDLSLSESKSLEQFIIYAFNQCQNYNSYIWGTYPVYNPFFRQPRKEITTHLNYIVGAFYGIINRPQLETIKLTITTNGQKEDVERTLKYFIQDGIVLRFNKIGFKTKYYGKEGGLGTFKDRLEPMKKACENLKQNYEKYGKIKVRNNGMCEFVLKKLSNFKN
jgi:hypothetical protein